MAEKTNADANPTGNNEFSMTEDPEQPEGARRRVRSPQRLLL